LAISVIEDHRFSFEPDGRPDALRTPVYPLFISGAYQIFGIRPWVVLILQSLLDSFSCILLFLTAGMFFQERAAFWSGLFYAVDPHLVFYTSNFYSETVFVFFLVLGMLFVGSWIKSDFSKTTSLIASASCFGVSALTRPVAAYLPFLFALFAVIVFHKSLGRALRFIAVFSLVFLTVLTPWFVRNYRTFKHVGLSTAGAFNNLAIQASPMEMARRGQDAPTVKQALLDEAEQWMRSEHPKDAGAVNDFDRSRYWRKLAWKYVAGNPFGYVKYSMVGIFQAMFSPGTKGFMQHLGMETRSPFDMKRYPNPCKLLREFVRNKSGLELMLGAGIVIYLGVVYFFSIKGFFNAVRGQGDTTVKFFCIFCLLSAIYFIGLIGSAGISRFRMPAIPFYLAFAGYGFDRLNTHDSKKHTE
jgi:4-amino-4-deoxy-L-arabinose transferase-like glycosyltransferase